jgi:hypothetical protein
MQQTAPHKVLLCAPEKWSQNTKVKVKGVTKRCDPRWDHRECDLIVTTAPHCWHHSEQLSPSSQKLERDDTAAMLQQLMVLVCSWYIIMTHL